MLHRALKLARQFHRLKLSEVADQLGLSKAYLSEIENGKKRPTVDILEGYAQICDVPLSSLLIFSEGLESGNFKYKVANKALQMMEWIAATESRQT